jgi:hypothetical protein
MSDVMYRESGRLTRGRSDICQQEQLYLIYDEWDQKSHGWMRPWPGRFRTELLGGFYRRTVMTQHNIRDNFMV